MTNFLNFSRSSRRTSALTISIVILLLINTFVSSLLCHAFTTSPSYQHHYQTRTRLRTPPTVFARTKAATAALSTTLYSTREVGADADAPDSVLEDVDGIGEIITTTTTETNFVNDLLVDVIPGATVVNEIPSTAQEDVKQMMDVGVITNSIVNINVASALTANSGNSGPSLDSNLEDIINESKGTQEQELIESTAVIESVIETALENQIIDTTTAQPPLDSNLVDILNETNDTQAQELIDPAAVVEAVIGTVLDNQNIDTVATVDNLLDFVSSADITDDTSSTTTIGESKKQLEEEKQLQEEEEKFDVPNLAKITKFAIPAIGIWLCSPLLSLIDTGSVGLLSGTIQQAALNPAVAITDYGALLVAFMYTATTNLVASARSNEMSSEDKPQTKKTLMNALQLSAYVGVALGTTLIGLAPTLLKAIIGNDQIDPRVFAAALRYVRIRALGMPAAVIIGSAQSACIGMQDVRSPMYVLLAAAIVNLIGDILFVPRTSALIGGAAGAAWATVFSQYAALFLFFKWMTSKPKPKPINLTKAILELTGKSDEGKSRRKQFRRALRKLSNVNHSKNERNENGEDAKPGPIKKITAIFKKKAETETTTQDSEKGFTVKGFLAYREKELLSTPSFEDAKTFWPYFLPVTATSVGRVSAYVSMSHVVSSSLGTMSMAANQVVLSVFYCLTPIADSLNLTAQSFVPTISQRKPSAARTKALRKISLNFLKSGLIFSVGMVGAIGCLPLFSQYFTSDPAVIALVNSIVPILSGVFAVHGVVCALEGVLLGQKDLNFLGKSYASFFFLVPFFMLRVKKAALQGVQDIGLNSLWIVFFWYNVVRAMMWNLRTKMLSDKTVVETE